MNDKELEVFSNLKDVKVVFDIGARDDVEYIKLKPRAEYHLFEPNTEFFDKLKEKVGNKKNVYLNHFGLGDHNGDVVYYQNQQSFEGSEHPELVGASAVYPMRRLDDYIEENNIQSIDFLKIDTEGWDYGIIACSPKAVEISRNIQYEYWDKREQFHKLLEDRFDMEYIGYRNVICRRR